MKLKSLYEELSRTKVMAILKNNPDFFKNEKFLSSGILGGAFDFTLELDPEDVNDYVDGDFTIRRYTNKEGREVKIGLFETILSGDTWDLWEPNSYDGDWEGALDYHVNQENENKIKVIIDRYITESGNDPEDFKEHTLQDLIEEFDENDQIKHALRSALGDSEADSYHNYLYKTLKEACEEIGEVIKFNDEGVHIKVTFSDVVSGTYDLDSVADVEELSDYFERCDWDPACTFREMIYYHDKPSFSSDDRWYPDIDDQNFNMILDDRLYEIE